MKIQKKKYFFFFFGGGGRVRGGGGVGLGWGGQDGWERRIEAFVKIQKKYFLGGSGRGVLGEGGGGASGLGVRVDANGKVKFL